jgi:hypothetical protein
MCSINSLTSKVKQPSRFVNLICPWYPIFSKGNLLSLITIPATTSSTSVVCKSLVRLMIYIPSMATSCDVGCQCIPSITLWAPTARNVTLQLFADSNARTEPTLYPMSYNAEQGTWRIVGQPAWRGQFYLFDVEVFVPTEMAVLNNQVTDPIA